MTLTEEEAEQALTRYAEARDSRDDLVFAAFNAGLSKHRIHELSGIARTTIDRIIAADIDRILAENARESA